MTDDDKIRALEAHLASETSRRQSLEEHDNYLNESLTALVEAICPLCQSEGRVTTIASIDTNTGTAVGSMTCTYCDNEGQAEFEIFCREAEWDTGGEPPEEKEVMGDRMRRVLEGMMRPHDP